MAKILIVEDDKEFRTALETMVRLEGHDVLLAADGTTGFEQAFTRKPDIILTDIGLPGMDGLAFVRKVRENPTLSHAYCILITGQAGQDMKLSALRAGADDFLEKPASRPEILGRVEIAQKVIAVQRLQREAETRARTLAEAPRKALDALAGLEAALASAETAIGKRDVPGLVAAMKSAKAAAGLIRAACAGTEAPAEGSWL